MIGEGCESVSFKSKKVRNLLELAEKEDSWHCTLTSKLLLAPENSIVTHIYDSILKRKKTQDSPLLACLTF